MIDAPQALISSGSGRSGFSFFVRELRYGAVLLESLLNDRYD